MHSSNDNTCSSNHNPSSIPFPLDYDMCMIPNPNPIPNFNFDQDLQFINTFIVPNSPEFDFLHHLFYPNYETPMNPTTPPPSVLPLDIHHSAMMMNCSYENDNGNGNGDDMKTETKTKTKKEKKSIRTSNKDRHSKIHTVNGPRDRRMRLSLSVATKFFWLQDLLGFDKASCTVDWLLTKSAAAIHDLKGGGREGGGGGWCSTGDGEVGETTKMPSGKKKKKKGGRRTRATVGKESRRKARERARMRTSQKRRLVCQSNCTNLAFVEPPVNGGAWYPIAGDYLHYGATPGEYGRVFRLRFCSNNYGMAHHFVNM